MSEPEVPFYVIGALVTLYIIAATWRSRDAAYPPAAERQSAERQSEEGQSEEGQAATLRVRSFDRRVVHWWRALRRGR